MGGKTSSCGCLNSDLKGKNSARYTGYEEISGCFWASLKNNAKIRNLEFNLTIKYIWILFLKQNRKCILSNIELEFGSNGKEETTASLDRIDSSKGYVENNVQWVHKDINFMKQDFNEEYFIDLCYKICEHKLGVKK